MDRNLPRREFFKALVTNMLISAGLVATDSCANAVPHGIHGLAQKVDRTRDSVEERVRNIVSEQLGVKKEKVTLKARFVEDLGADSLDLVEMIMAFEEEFQIEIPDEDCGRIHTVQEAVDYIKNHTRTEDKHKRPKQE